MAAAMTFAEELITRSPDSIAASKQLINNIWGESIKGVLHWETQLQKKVMGRWNQLAAASRNMSKNPKEYRKRRIK
jgi:enoyl-CoA hydratase/carnithine racemase